MKNYWTQPSLSRDFALLAAAVIFLLFLISTWVTYTTYNAYAERIAGELEKESQRIEHALTQEMESASYMLEALGKQIVLNDARTLTTIAQRLKSFDSKGSIYSIFSWVNPEQFVVVSSNRGVLDKPVDVSDRDYVKESAIDPWKMHIGRPIEGRVSERWVIPVAMGLTDYTGKFIGTIMISIDIHAVTERLQNLMRNDGIDFAIVSKNLIPLTQVSSDKDFVSHTFPVDKIGNLNFSQDSSGLITQANLFFGVGNYFYYRTSSHYPYVLLLGYDARQSDELVHSMLWSRLLQLLVIAVFFVLFLWIMRTRMIKPVLAMTSAAEAVAHGRYYHSEPLQGPEEIRLLSSQIARISEYIEESKRIEDELRNKVFMLKKAKERSETAMRSKSEFLAYACQEIRAVLNHIIGFAQSMRDQLHGPIENRKYRQYAADIYDISNTLLGYTQDLLTFSKTETGYITLMEKPVDVAEIVNKTLRFMADKMSHEKHSVKVKLQEPSPKLIVDEFRLQQILTNTLLYMFHHTPEGQSLTLEMRVITEHKDRQSLVMIVNNDEKQAISNADLLAWLETLHNAPELTESTPRDGDDNRDQAHFSLDLVQSLVALHQGYTGIKTEEKSITLAIFFPASRIHFKE